MTATPREVDAVYRVLTRTYPRSAPFWILAKAAHPLPQRITRAALRILHAAGLAHSPRRGHYAATQAPAAAARAGIASRPVHRSLTVAAARARGLRGASRHPRSRGQFEEEQA
jgi:hypothetical protein